MDTNHATRTAVASSKGEKSKGDTGQQTRNNDSIRLIVFIYMELQITRLSRHSQRGAIMEWLEGLGYGAESP